MLRIHMTVVLFLGMLASDLPAAREWLAADQAKLTVLIELASDVPASPEQLAARDALIKPLSESIAQADAEYWLAIDPRDPVKVEAFNRLATPEGEKIADLLWAMLQSYGGFEAAHRGNDPKWSAEHHAAMAKWAGLAVQKLRVQAKEDADRAQSLATTAIAQRRSAEKDFQFKQSFKASGFSQEQRQRFAGAGYSPESIDTLQKRLQSEDRKLGFSIAELYQAMSALRFRLADHLQSSVLTGEFEARDVQSQFTLFNPKDAEATVSLLLRPQSMPAGWTATVTEVDFPASGERRVIQRQPGERYDVTLPAKGSLKVMSTVVPSGEGSANTSVRWAVEGYIGREYIGGMVFEQLASPIVPVARNVVAPTAVAPATVASALTPAAPGPPAVIEPGGSNRLWWVTGGVAAVLVVLFLILLNRRPSTR